jgi:hypothetical protein
MVELFKLLPATALGICGPKRIPITVAI